jgi:hypothetical protein
MQLIEVNCPYQLQLQVNSKHAASLHDPLSRRAHRRLLQSITLQPSLYITHSLSLSVISENRNMPCTRSPAQMQLHVRRLIN